MAIMTTRATWDSEWQGFLSGLAYVIGFGNIMVFPYLMFENGAAFLIPYMLVLFLAGIPLLLLDLYLGQLKKCGPNIIFGRQLPVSTGLGWAMVSVSGMVSIYYNVIIAWALYYTFSSFSQELPWSRCRHDFNSDSCFSMADRLACLEKDQFYLERGCHSIEHMCALVEKVPFKNKTLCADTDGQNVVHPDRVIPRTYASEEFFMSYTLMVQGRTWSDFGTLQWELVGFLALAWVLVCLCLAEGIKSSGKAVYITTLFRYIPLTAFFVLAVTLEGSEKGIIFYLLDVDWQKLKHPEIWIKAASHVFYNLGTSFGGIITLGSYNNSTHNCMRDAILIGIVDTMTSFFFGLVIFSILGSMATELDVAVTDVVSSGHGLVFIVVPEALTRIPNAQVWSVMFFIMTLFLGLDTQFGMVETMSTAVLDYLPSFTNQRRRVVFLICSICFMLGLTMVMEGGVLLLTVFHEQASGINVIVLALVEVFLLQYTFGFREILKTLQTEMNIWIPSVLYWYWAATWTVLTPLTLIIILVAALCDIQPLAWEDYIFPSWVQALGWLLCCFPISIIIIFHIYRANGTRHH
ncbi:sodium- and chloride-dependent glycine transporter 2-like isoform X2 [Oratosquilla oratoria]|uniref:sodium- and chloride-dependent glycine transporter 2-like isoform X2 n=1 Tax=Oratosquilla oratoria TaxID=337810 RepID=UPI003F75F2CA